MTNKPQTEKQKAHQAFKRHKAGMALKPDEILLVKRHYSFMRNGTEVK